MVSESKAEPVDQGSGRISEEDSQLFHRSKSSTKHTEAWARARFDAWRTLQKRHTNLSIEELGDLDMKELGETVWMFLTQVRKQNGKEYPAETCVYTNLNHVSSFLTVSFQIFAVDLGFIVP
jgi:hypothetical protein